MIATKPNDHNLTGEKKAMNGHDATADQGRTDRTTDQILVLLNVSHIFMIIMTAIFFAAMFTDLAPDGTMRWVVAAGVILFSDLAFIGIGVALEVAARSVKVTAVNKWLVWLTIPVLSIPPAPELYAGIIGFFPTDHQIAWVAIALSAILSLWTFYETLPVWKRIHEEQK